MPSLTCFDINKGHRVRLSDAAVRAGVQHYTKKDVLGTCVALCRRGYNAQGCVMVVWDGTVTPMKYARQWLEIVPG